MTPPPEHSPDSTNRLAVLGHPVGHSRSPAMHNAALAALGMDGSWSYEAIEVEPEGFEEEIRSLPARGFVGANVTVPHKRAALEVADTASAAALEIGAANTLTFDAGAVLAANTDAGGLLAALPDLDGRPGFPGGARALVLGAGGASRAVVWALAGAGAEVSVWNRTASRAAALCEELGGSAIDAGGIRGSGRFDLIVNASAAGLGGGDALEDLPLSASDLGPGQVVVDMVYGGRPSGLIEAAGGAGAVTVDGIEVLVAQGALSFEIWTGEAAPIEVMREAARA